MTDQVLLDLYEVVLSRKKTKEEGSYTCYLFDQGLDKILKKVGEESAETIIAAKNDSAEELIGEVADLLYHLTVLLAEKNVPMQSILKLLDERAQKIGNLKVMKNTDKNT